MAKYYCNLILAKPALITLKDYENQKKQGIQDSVFDPKALGIKNADYWEKEQIIDKEWIPPRGKLSN